MRRATLALIVAVIALCSSGCSADVQADGVFWFGKHVQPSERAAVKAGVKAMQDWAYANGQVRLKRFTVRVDDNLDSLVSDYEAETADPNPLATAQWLVSGGALTHGRTIYIYVGPHWTAADEATKSFIAAHETFHVIQYGYSYDDWRLNMESSDLPPPWYMEGGADYAAARALDAAGIEPYQTSHDDSLEQSASYSRSLASITRGPADHSSGDAAAYAVGFLAVERLAQQNGETAMFDLWDSLAEEGDWAAAFALTYHGAVSEFVATFDGERSSSTSFVTGGVSGAVSRESGDAIPGASIVACEFAERERRCRITWTAEDGTFDLALPAGQWRVGYEVATRTGTEQGLFRLPGTSAEVIQVGGGHISGLNATVHKPF